MLRELAQTGIFMLVAERIEVLFADGIFLCILAASQEAVRTPTLMPHSSKRREAASFNKTAQTMSVNAPIARKVSLDRPLPVRHV